MPGSKKCEICGTPFEGPTPKEVICEPCRHSLPQCDSCHIVMSILYGFLDSYAKTVGKLDICGHCNNELKEKGYLQVSEGRDNKYLLPSGEVVFEKPKQTKVSFSS